jgi:KipI family sensor histidine kinase inhibitor
VTRPPAARSADLHVAECGDSGLLVTLTGAGDQPWRMARHIATSLLQDPPAGLVDVVASYASVFLAFDPLQLAHAELRDLVTRQALADPGPDTSRDFLVPMVYGGDHGEDLAAVAEELSLDADDVVRMHTGAVWTVRLLGPPMGMPMTDGGRPPRPVSRRSDPRTRVPAGSVGLSGHQSVVYPFEMPGGWQLIGRTPAELVDLARDPATAYATGDRLRFVAVPGESWARWRRPLTEVQAELARLTVPHD